MGRVSWLLLCLVACGRIDFDPVPEIPLPSCPLGPFTAPQHLDVVNSPSTDWGPAISDDGLTLYFSSFRGGNEDMYVATRGSPDATWNAAQPLAELAAPGDEEGNVSVSTDGLTLYWGQHKLWRSTRQSREDSWRPAELLLDEGNGLTELQGPDISYDDLSLYFTANISATDRNLFVMKRTSSSSAFGPPAPVDGANSTDEDAWSATSPDELELYFSSGRLGTSMLFMATRASRSDPWGTPAPILGGRTDIFDADLSSDYRSLFIATQGADSLGGYDLYVATRDCL